MLIFKYTFLSPNSQFICFMCVMIICHLLTHLYLLLLSVFTSIVCICCVVVA